MSGKTDLSVGVPGPAPTPAQDLTTEQKIRLEHELGVRRIFLDRLFVGLLLALAAYLAGLALERYKTDAAESRFFLEKRLEAALLIRAAMSDVTSSAFAQTVPACNFDLSNRPSTGKLRAATDDLIAKVNSSAVLLTEAYRLRVDLLINIFSGAAADNSKISCESRYFFNDLADYFTEATRMEVLGSSDLNWKRFIPIEVTKESLDADGSITYFVRNQERWNNTRAKSPP